MVHAVFDADETLAMVCKHPESHTNIDLTRPGTNTVIKRHYRAIEGPYLSMYAMSLGVRYEGQAVTEGLFADARRDFQDVCSWAERELRTAGRSVPDWLSAV